MTIETSKNNGAAVIKVGGRLDTMTVPEFEKVIVEDMGDVNELVLDFQDLVYISSVGLRVLLKAQKMMMKKGGMKVIHVDPSVMEIFEITDFVNILTIE